MLSITEENIFEPLLEVDTSYYRSCIIIRNYTREVEAADQKGAWCKEL